MGDDPHTAADQARQSRSMWRASVIVGVLLVICAGWILFYDGPPPDDAKMLPEWTPQEPGKLNPLAIFFGDLDSVLLEDFSKLPKNVQKREPGSEFEVHQFVAKQQPNFAAFDRLMATDTHAWQWPDGEKLADFSHTSMEFSHSGAVGQALRTKIHALTLDGKTEEAASRAVALARFGAGLHGAEGALIHSLVALTLQRMGEEALQQALTQAQTSRGLLRTCLRDLERIGPPSRSDLQFAYKADYLLFKNAVLKMDGRGLAAVWGTVGASSSVMNHFAQLLYKPNRTLAKRVELEHPLIDALDRNWQEAFTAAAAVKRFAGDMKPGGAHVGGYLDSNLAGTSLLALSLSASSSIIDKAMFSAVLHEQTRLILALRLFELENGKLPSRLEALVPDYVPAVPEDVFTGKPMRWDPASEVVYSVGPDGVDDGGRIDLAKPHKGADVGMRYWWFTNSP